MPSSAIVSSGSKHATRPAAKDQKNEEERLSRARAIAVQQALSIEEKKNLQNKVLDMILTAFDLPSDNDADPANPSLNDVTTLRQCLAIFRPSDLDELVSERNIDDRCGYALCKRPNHKEPPKMAWDSQGKLVEKKSDGQWCSDVCKMRNNFVRRQLSNEPAWLRLEQAQPATILMDGPQPPPNVPEIVVTNSTVQHHGDELAEERRLSASDGTENITIIEKEATKAPVPPNLADSDLLDGLPVRTIGVSRKPQP